MKRRREGFIVQLLKHDLKLNGQNRASDERVAAARGAIMRPGDLPDTYRSGVDRIRTPE
jgi:hypothetical protein